MSALDKFKRRLVRDIARRIYQEKQPEYDMWAQLKQDYGCDCHLLWEHMRALTLKKLKRLLAAQDRIDYITRIARMTSTDWLTYDLVLVHEKVDVIGEELISSGKPEPAVLSELFSLVKEYGIENLPPKNLIEAWFNLTKEYNAGGRQCSPMLLQRRWYDLKELTRSKVYKFWKLYRGNHKHLDKANTHRPSPLHLKIAEQYPNIITHPFVQWSDLVLKKQVVQAGAFERWRIMGSGSSTNDNDPDLVVVEPNVETIELVADSDNNVADYDDENIEKTGTKCKSYQELQRNQNVGVTIKTEPPDEITNNDEDENILQQLQNVKIPIKNSKEKLENVAVSTDSTEVTDSELTETPELNFPKITSVMGNAMISESYSEINELIQDGIVHKPNLNGESTKTLEGNAESDKIQIEDNKINCNSNIVTNLDELPLNLNFVDDGIELVDHDIDNIEEQKQDEREDEEREKEKSKENEDGTTTEIDQKLIMFPISYTKKLDHMNIFKNKSYLNVQGDHIIKSAILESKPNFKDVFSSTIDEKLNKDVNEETDEGVNGDLNVDNDSESYEVPRVNYTSWLLKKPRSRSYNPIQLCKNPDFNTRLKRLTVGFFSIERNRQLFNACKPLTIDLHKQFENKLVNNTLYLKNIDSVEVKQENNSDTSKNTLSVIPSAISVQSLLVNSKVNVEDLIPTKVDKVEPVYPENSPVSDSNKAKNLSDIDQLLLVNKNLLTVEISPIPLHDTSSDNKPPVQLITYPSPDPTTVIDFQPSSVSMNLNQNILPTLEKKQNKKRFLPKKLVIPKVKPSNKRPPWSCLLQEPVDDSLITKDTLDKVLCLLNGVQVKNVKKKKKSILSKAAKSTTDVNTSILWNERNHLEIIEKNDQLVNTINDDELKESVAFLQTQNTELSKVKEKERRGILVKQCRPVPSRIKYCCWARYKWENHINIRRGPKPKHKCPKSLCTCCCRNLLSGLKIGVEENLTASKDYDTYKEDDAHKTQIEKAVITFCDDENNVVTNCLPLDEVRETDSQTVSIDIANVPNPECSIQSPHLTNILPYSFGAVQFEMASAGLKNSVDTNEKFPPEKRDIRSINKHSGSCTEVKRVLVPQATSVQHAVQKKVNVLKKHLLRNADTVKPNINSETKIETISLLEDEPSNSTELSSPPLPVKDSSPKPILPDGVNLVLLPDNTLSVNINPDVVIDPESLSKLPEILTAVQKHLNLTILQTQPQSNKSNAVNSNGKLNIPCKMPIGQNLEHNVVNSEIESNTLLDEPSNLAEEGSNKSQNGNFQVDTSEACLDNSNITSEGISVNLKANEQFLENDTSCVQENKGKQEVKQSEVVNEAVSSCKADSNRKSILTDLMTMSGISSDDINIVGGPVLLPPTIINSSLDDRNDVVGNGNLLQNLDRKKVIKKIMISIRKKSKVNGQLDTNSVIDLTEDNETTSSKMDTNETDKNESSLQTLLKKYVSKLKNRKPVQLNEIPKPVNLIKTSPKSLLRNPKKVIIPFEEVDSRLKLIIAKHYRQYNRKPSSLKILQANGEIMEVKCKPKIKRKPESDSDSSDDEPLAKKFKRIKAKGNVINQELIDETTESIVEVPKYDLPIEFSNEPTEVVEEGDNMDSNTEVDGNCILGV